VKAFYGILKIIFITSPAYMWLISITDTADNFEYHISSNLTDSDNSSYTIAYGIKLAFLENISIFHIPFYILILRPFVSYYIPSMLKRMAVGIVVVIHFTLDTAAHAENRSLQCMFSFDT